MPYLDPIHNDESFELDVSNADWSKILPVLHCSNLDIDPKILEAASRNISRPNFSTKRFSKAAKNLLLNGHRGVFGFYEDTRRDFAIEYANYFDLKPALVLSEFRAYKDWYEIAEKNNMSVNLFTNVKRNKEKIFTYEPEPNKDLYVTDKSTLISRYNTNFFKQFDREIKFLIIDDFFVNLKSTSTNFSEALCKNFFPILFLADRPFSKNSYSACKYVYNTSVVWNKLQGDSIRLIKDDIFDNSAEKNERYEVILELLKEVKLTI